MSAITSNRYGSRAADRRDYALLLGFVTPVIAGGVALRRLGLLPDPARHVAARQSFIHAVRSRVAALVPFAFMG